MHVAATRHHDGILGVTDVPTQGTCFANASERAWCVDSQVHDGVGSRRSEQRENVDDDTATTHCNAIHQYTSSQVAQIRGSAPMMRVVHDMTAPMMHRNADGGCDRFDCHVITLSMPHVDTQCAALMLSNTSMITCTACSCTTTISSDAQWSAQR